MSPAWQGRFLTTGPPGKTPKWRILLFKFNFKTAIKKKKSKEIGERILYTSQHKTSMAVLISDKIDLFKQFNGSETRKNKSVHVAHINCCVSVWHL